MKNENSGSKAVSGVSRRTLIKTGLAVGGLLALERAGWAAGASAAPTRGGHFRAGVGGANTGDSLDPSTFTDTFMISLSFAIRDNLVAVGADNSLEAGLAESWEANKNATEWTFKIRRGVHFSNGKSLTTDDVITSINYHRGDKSKSGAASLLERVKDISAVGDDAVKFTLKFADVDFPFVLTDYHLNILPSADGSVDWKSGAGTGPYKLESFEPGVSAKLSRSAEHWNSAVGFFDSIELVAINDAATRQNALIYGEVDAISKPDLKLISFLERNKDIQIVDVPGRIWHCGIMRTDIAPFDNNDLRLALKYSIDRKEYLQKVLKGYGTIGNDNPIGPAYLLHAADIAPREYDLDKAKFHLNKAGYKQEELKLLTCELFPGMNNAVELYQQQAEKAGVNIKIETRPTDGWFTDVWLKEPFQWGWWGPRITEDLMLSLTFLSTAPWNDAKFKSPRLDELINGARAELDEAKRREMYREAQLIISNEGGHVIPANANLVQAVNKKVLVPRDDSGKWKISASWEMDGGYFLKRWSFA